MKFHTLCLIFLMLLHHNCFAQYKNVLFVISDDLRPDVGVYTGEDDTFFRGIQTPNLDKFAQDSLTFTRAYVQQAICAPSRTSFLTGRRPDTTRAYDLDTYWRESGGNFTTIPQYFKENGYLSINAGKIFHSGKVSGNDDRDYSWSETPYREPGDERWENHDYSWQIAEPEEDEAIPQRDTLIKDYAIEKLQELAPGGLSGEQPFFLAVGFHRPHLPLVAPRRFFNLYPESNISIASNPYVPENLPNVAYSSWGELRAYADVAALEVDGSYNTSLPDYFAIDLRRAYYASISFVDSLFGEIMDEVNRLGLTDNTIVIFFSDNGFQLGEHSEWCKHTNFEVAAQVPIMLRIPGITTPGHVTSAFVELVDIFPTLVEASGLPVIPLCPLDSSDVLVCHEGYSMVDLAQDQEEGKKAAFYQYPRNSHTKMGYVIRTDDYQYVRWVEFRGIPVWNDVFEEELYDISTDPNMNVNVAERAEYASVKQDLDAMLRAGWREALPVQNYVK